MADGYQVRKEKYWELRFTYGLLGRVRLIAAYSLWFGVASKHFKRVHALFALAKMLRFLISSFVGACEIKESQRFDVTPCHLLNVV